ncbi:MAG: hypothetical protein C5B57_07190 [Blastocatellia bacterium]|nr:MAG: hypothetical protein C5B57_07190 [Blastocatellia bacterium]
MPAAAALGCCFRLHGTDVRTALLHYERVRHFRATRFQFGSKFLFKHLDPAGGHNPEGILAQIQQQTCTGP